MGIFEDVDMRASDTDFFPDAPQPTFSCPDGREGADALVGVWPITGGL